MSEPAEIKAREIVDKTLDKLAASPSINLSEASAERMKPAIVKEMSSVIVNQTNQEPWYQSRVTLGALMAVAAGAAGLAGYTLDAEDQAYWVETISQGVALGTSIASLVGGAVAWYGRWIARKPIGE